jgi:hypothetical protein
MMEYYSLTAPATSRRGAAGFIKVYLSERDSEVNDQSHDALILWSAARMKRAKQTGASVREYVEKAEYEEMRFRSLWVKA